MAADSGRCRIRSGMPKPVSAVCTFAHLRRIFLHIGSLLGGLGGACPTRRSSGARVYGGRVFQTRFHGRGGRVVTAAELLSVAAFRAGRHAQAFPSFGSERTGALVVSYCRIDDRPIRSGNPSSCLTP